MKAFWFILGLLAISMGVAYVNSSVLDQAMKLDFYHAENSAHRKGGGQGGHGHGRGGPKNATTTTTTTTTTAPTAA